MMKIKSKTGLWFFLSTAILGNLAAFGQSNFKYRAALPIADSSGFYRIHLQPLLLAKSNRDLSDVRIVTAGNQYVPYINGRELQKAPGNIFSVFPFVDYHSTADTGTVRVIANKAHLTIDKVWLQLRNTDVVRTVSLSGSDNLNNWYAIKENVLLEAAGMNAEGKYEQILKFPPVNYKYIKIVVNDRYKNPVQLLRAGIYRRAIDNTGALPYVKLPEGELMQKDSGTVSYVILKFNAPFLIHKLHISLSGTKYFRRRVRVYQADGDSSSLLRDTMVSSSAVNQDLFFDRKAKVLKLEIVNDDNAPLVVNEITAYQSDQSLISYLEKGMHYQVLFGDAKASAPQYDMKFFTDSIQQVLRDLHTERVTSNPLYKVKKVESESRYRVWLVWGAIGCALIILLVITLKLTNEVNKKAAGSQEDAGK